MVWTTLAVDVADASNKLPQELRAQIFYLSEFVQLHTGKVLARKARLAPLLVRAGQGRCRGHQ